MRMVVFAGLGMALVPGILLHRLGPLAGVAALAGGAVTRSLTVRAEPKRRGY